MALLIDWHSHHTPPEIAEEFSRFTGRTLPIDQFDSPDFSQRVKEMDRVGLDVQLICQGAGLYADRLPAEQANDPSLKRLEDEGAGVIYSVVADAYVSECVVRMIASGLFDRHPNLKIVIRTGGGGLPLLLHRMFWKHKGRKGERRYSEIFLEHFLIDTAGVNARTLQFLIDTLGEERVVFGSDYCGGLGPLGKALPVITDQPDPAHIKSITERNSRRLLKL